jgi:hypothetical protein
VSKKSRDMMLLRYRDVCKRDMQAADIDLVAWEKDAIDRSAWHC